MFNCIIPLGEKNAKGQQHALVWMWPKCFQVGFCALLILVGRFIADVFDGVCATPINKDNKRAREVVCDR